MARQPSPWRRRGERGDWHAWIKGKCVWLAPHDASKTQAQSILTRLLADVQKGKTPRAGGLVVRDVINLFLAHCEAAVARGELAPLTLEGYSRYLLPSRAALGRHPVAAIKPAHVTAWLETRPGWKNTSRYNAITALKRALRWAKREGHTTVHPLADMARPQQGRREKVMTPEQIDRLVAAIRPRDPFRLLVEALRETGARPGETCTLTADRVDEAARTWVVTNKTRHATGEKTRVVYLSDRALAITKGLLNAHPTGLLFRNTKGRAWTRNAIALRMGRLAEKLGMGEEAVAYSLRHDFATTALQKGIPPATVAELLGHRSLTMVMRIYNRLSTRTEHLREAARSVRSESGGLARKPVGGPETSIG